MKITLCGSIAFYPEMVNVKEQLEELGYEVRLPPTEVLDEDGVMIPVAEYYTRRKAAEASDTWIWERKAQAMRWHFDKVTWADVILVVNPPKNGVEGYIGANTLIEMGLAFHLEKPIYLMHPIPELPYTEEIRGMQPIVVSNLGMISY